MAELTCADGTRLVVTPVAVHDRDGVPYEVTLRMERDGTAFGEVGERCGYFLASTAARLRAARAAGRDFPDSSLEAGVRSWARDVAVDPDATWESLLRSLPRDRELFSFRSRDPDDLATVGELRVRLEEVRSWSGASGSARGTWGLRRCAVLEAWGGDGTGVRAVLGSDELLAFLERLVQEFADVGAAYDPSDDASALRRPVG